MILLQIIYIWLITTLIGVISFPLFFSICPRLKDRGYSISKILGLTTIAFIAWILSSLKLLPFGTFSVGLATAVLAALSFWLGRKNREELFSFLRKNLKLILGLELIFLVGLAFFLLVISLNPNIDPDSERFMDYALLNGIDRTEYFPPLDPWFGGRIMNYYYYGYIIVSALHKLVAIPLPFFFNLVLGTIYSLFTLTCFGIGYNLTGKKSYGFLAIVAVMMIGNLDGLIQVVGKGFLHFRSFDSARVLVQTASDGTILDYPINEFPFFSLIYGDLHPYVITYLINMAILNLLLNLALSPSPGWRALGKDLTSRIISLSIISVAIGCLLGAHTWDYPVYLAVGVTILAYLQWRHRPAEGPVSDRLVHFARFIPPALSLVVLSFILYLPFNLNFIREQTGQERGGIGEVSLRTPLGLFLIALGIYILFLAAYLASHLRKASFKPPERASRAPFNLFLIASLIVIVFSWSGEIMNQTYLLLILLFVLSAVALLISPLETGEHFSLILALVALGLTIFSEFFFMIDHYQGGGYERMNTMFKLYTNVWLLLGAASVYSIFFVNRRLEGSPKWRFTWKTFVLLALAAGLFFPLAAVGERIRGCRQPLTLDGVAYLEEPVPDYQKKEWRWDQDDWKAIHWLEENVSGRPIILETTGNAYDWASRIATFTGLPTLVGWVNHEAGWRNDWDEAGRRQKDTQTIYTTTNSNVALNLIYRYKVKYIYIGRLERELYPEDALAKFAGMGTLVYQDGPVEIYQVGK